MGKAIRIQQSIRNGSLYITGTPFTIDDTPTPANGTINTHTLGTDVLNVLTATWEADSLKYKFVGLTPPIGGTTLWYPICSNGASTMTVPVAYAGISYAGYTYVFGSPSVTFQNGNLSVQPFFSVECSGSYNQTLSGLSDSKIFISNLRINLNAGGIARGFNVLTKNVGVSVSNCSFLSQGTASYAFRPFFCTSAYLSVSGCLFYTQQTSFICFDMGMGGLLSAAHCFCSSSSTAFTGTRVVLSSGNSTSNIVEFKSVTVENFFNVVRLPPLSYFNATSLNTLSCANVVDIVIWSFCYLNNCTLLGTRGAAIWLGENAGVRFVSSTIDGQNVANSCGVKNYAGVSSINAFMNSIGTLSIINCPNGAVYLDNIATRFTIKLPSASSVTFSGNGASLPGGMTNKDVVLNSTTSVGYTKADIVAAGNSVIQASTQNMVRIE
jgi:hypothetical protein